MSLGSPGFSVARSRGFCAATGLAIAPGERFITALVEREGIAGLERVDYSEAAWDDGARPGQRTTPARDPSATTDPLPPERLFGFWRAHFNPAETKKQPLLSDEELLDLFTELSEATEERRIAFRYLLALHLVRRRVLRCVATTRAGMSVTPKGADASVIIEVKDPGMSDLMIAEAIEQLGEIIPAETQSA